MRPLRDLSFTIPSLRAAYEQGARPPDVVREAYRRIADVDDPGIFIHLAAEADVVAEAEALGDPGDRVLWGLPFVVKDNIDVAGMPTTAACPAFAYIPDADAAVVARLRAAGALVLGKTNLDQFATGLVGVRTPYPVPRNALDPSVVPGGSSSGSAVAVAHGLVPFALGTDTAGSGRVPAALNNIVGLKPTLGALSSTGLVPACRTIDTISLFALTVADAYEVFGVAAGYDAADPWSRAATIAPLTSPPPALTLGVPDEASATFCGDTRQERAFRNVLDRLVERGVTLRPIDLRPFLDVARLLYDGSWVAERYAVVEPLLGRDHDAIHPVTRAVVERAASLSAADAFRDAYRLAALKREVAPVLQGVDAVCVPTVPAFYSLADVEADPIGPNSALGTYTNFVNLLDLCGLAVPTVPREDGRPGGVTLLAPAGRDALLASLGLLLERLGPRTLGATGAAVPAPPTLADRAVVGELEIAVCGAHMSGMALNGELTSRGGRFLRSGETSEDYRLYALPGGPPHRPGLLRVGQGGAAIAVEVWALPLEAVGSFLAGIPSPLGLATVHLADGSRPKGFVCEAVATEHAEDVSAFGNWRAFAARLAS